MLLFAADTHSYFHLLPSFKRYEHTFDSISSGTVNAIKSSQLWIIHHMVNLALWLIWTNLICATAFHRLTMLNRTKIQPLLSIRTKICACLSKIDLLQVFCQAPDIFSKCYVNVSTSTFCLLWPIFILNHDCKCNHSV